MSDANSTAAAPSKPAITAAPAAAEENPSPPSPHEKAVDEALAQWVGSFLNNSPLSRHADAYNHVQAVLPELRAALLKLGE